MWYNALIYLLCQLMSLNEKNNNENNTDNNVEYIERSKTINRQ